MDQEIKELLQTQNNILEQILQALIVRKRTTKKNFEMLFNFNEVYAIYPRKEGKTLAFQKLSQTITTEEEFKLLKLATKRYSDMIRLDGTERKFILLFSTFAGRWRDYLPLENNKIVVKKAITDQTNLLI